MLNNINNTIMFYKIFSVKNQLNYFYKKSNNYEQSFEKRKSAHAVFLLSSSAPKTL